MMSEWDKALEEEYTLDELFNQAVGTYQGFLNSNLQLYNQISETQIDAETDVLRHSLRRAIVHYRIAIATLDVAMEFYKTGQEQMARISYRYANIVALDAFGISLSDTGEMYTYQPEGKSEL